MAASTIVLCLIAANAAILLFLYCAQEVSKDRPKPIKVFTEDDEGTPTTAAIVTRLHWDALTKQQREE